MRVTDICTAPSMIGIRQNRLGRWTRSGRWFNQVFEVPRSCYYAQRLGANHMDYAKPMLGEVNPAYRPSHLSSIFALVSNQLLTELINASLTLTAQLTQRVFVDFERIQKRLSVNLAAMRT